MNAGKRARGFKKIHFFQTFHRVSHSTMASFIVFRAWEPATYASGRYDRGEDRHDIPGGCLLRNLAGHKTLKYI